MAQPKTVEELKAEVEELRSFMTSTRAELRKMETCIEEFRQKYEPLLAAMAVSSTYWGSLRRELLLHALKGSVWAMLAAIGVIVVLGARSWFKGWLA